jgi:hypothetical protein
MLFLTNGVLLEMYLLAYGAPLYKLYYERNVLAASTGLVIALMVEENLKKAFDNSEQ